MYRALCRAALAPGYHQVRIPRVAGQSLEDAARAGRHAVFEQALAADDCILLAHHRNDQVETLLHHLFRGSGVHGLAGMPEARPCGQGTLLRPLLTLPREQLLAYARQQGLSWIEDPSNQDTHYTRNHLRHAVLPSLRERWPGIDASLARSATVCAESAGLLDTLARIDLVTAAGTHANRLRVSKLRALSPARQRNLLRHWLHTLHLQRQLPPPNHRLLQAIVGDLLPAAADAEPCLRWGQGAARGELHRFQDEIHALRPLPMPVGPLQWDTAQPLTLPPPLGTLQLEHGVSTGLPVSLARTLDVRFRQGGEKVAIPGRVTRTLKNLLREQGVPPWLRGRVPLVYAAGQLVAVGDLQLGKASAGNCGENCAKILWLRSDSDCGY